MIFFHCGINDRGLKKLLSENAELKKLTTLSLTNNEIQLEIIDDISFEHLPRLTTLNLTLQLYPKLVQRQATESRLVKYPYDTLSKIVRKLDSRGLVFLFIDAHLHLNSMSRPWFKFQHSSVTDIDIEYSCITINGEKR